MRNFKRWALLALGMAALAFGSTIVQNVMTTLGDLIYGGTNGTPTRLAGNITTTPKVLTQIGDGVNSAAPSWQVLPSGGQLIYYFTNTASDIATYLQATAAPFSPKTTLTFAALAAGTTTVQNWATNAGIPNLTFIPAGAYQFHVHALRTGAAGTVKLQAIFVEANAAGADVSVIGTSEASAVLGLTENEYTLFFVNPNVHVMAATTSRMVARVQAVVTGGSTPDVNVFVGGTADSNLALPSNTVDATNFVPYTGATANVLLGARKLQTPIIFPAADSTTAVQITKANGTTSVFTVDTTNSRLGVGTTPAVKFHVSGSANDAAIMLDGQMAATGLTVNGSYAFGGGGAPVTFNPTFTAGSSQNNSVLSIAPKLGGTSATIVGLNVANINLNGNTATQYTAVQIAAPSGATNNFALVTLGGPSSFSGNLGVNTIFPTGGPALSLTVKGSSVSFDSSILGSELAVSDATCTGWTLNAGWACSAGVITHTAGTATADFTPSLTATARYMLVFSVASRTLGSVTPQVGGVAASAVSTNVASTFNIQTTSTGHLIFTPTTDFNGSITVTQGAGGLSLKQIIGGTMENDGGYRVRGLSGVTVTACTQFTLGICTAGT